MTPLESLIQKWRKQSGYAKHPSDKVRWTCADELSEALRALQAQQSVAWAVLADGKVLQHRLFANEADAEACWKESMGHYQDHNPKIVPLYASPPLSMGATGEAPAVVKESAGGPNLLVWGVKTAFWFGNASNEEAHRIAGEINSEWRKRQAERPLTATDAGVPDLRQFVRDLFESADWPEGGDIDAFAFQDLAVKHGILVPTKMEKPCQEEGCSCAENGADFPTECLRKVPWLLAAPLSAEEE